MNYTCANPKCKMELVGLKSVDMLREPPSVDDILVCGNCGTLSKVTVTGTVLLTPDEFKALPKDERKDLEFAARAAMRPMKAMADILVPPWRRKK